MGAVPALGTYLFCLGIDSVEPMPSYRLAPGDELTLSQTVQLPAAPAQQLIRLSLQMRAPMGAPMARTVLTRGAVSFVTGGLMQAGDGAQGLILPAGSYLQAGELLLKVTGASTPNVGIFRAAALGRPVTGGFAAALLVSPGLVAEVAPNVRVDSLGMRWAARCYIDDNLRLELVEDALHVVERTVDLNVSQAAGTSVVVRFVLALEQVAP